MTKEEMMMKNLDELLERKIGRTKEYPTADAVVVIRCEDCYQYDVKQCFCNLHREFRHFSYFCASGERRKK